MEPLYRWEWRTFARKPAHSRFLSLTPDTGTIATREQYVLSLASSGNVKVRNGLLEIKSIVAVDATGLEQWRPVLKSPFPLDEAAIDAVWLAWGLPEPVGTRRRCTLAEFFGEMVQREPALSAVEIEKRRTRLTIEECPGEHVSLIIAGEEWESIAFEHADPARVWRAVKWAGLENADNTSYPAALKRITGFTAAMQPIKTEER